MTEPDRAVWLGRAFLRPFFDTSYLSSRACASACAEARALNSGSRWGEPIPERWNLAWNLGIGPGIRPDQPDSKIPTQFRFAGIALESWNFRPDSNIPAQFRFAGIALESWNFAERGRSEPPDSRTSGTNSRKFQSTGIS